MSFGDDEIEALKLYLMLLLEKNLCKIESVMFEWGDLKVEINFFSKNMEDYLNICRKVFLSLIKNECKNIIITIKILLIIFPI